MKTFTLGTEVVIAASAFEESRILNLRRAADDGIFSLYIVLTGTGTGKFEYLLSHDRVNFLTPSGGSDIVTAFTAGSDIISFTPAVAPYMQIKCTETGGANQIVVTTILTTR